MSNQADLVTRDEFETVKQLLGSAARYAESANRGLDLAIKNIL
jgi:BMFP domain-containing protein YqiC